MQTYYDRSLGWGCFQVPMPTCGRLYSGELWGSAAGAACLLVLCADGVYVCLLECAVTGVGEAFRSGVGAIVDANTG